MNVLDECENGLVAHIRFKRALNSFGSDETYSIVVLAACVPADAPDKQAKTVLAKLAHWIRKHYVSIVLGSFTNHL